MGRARKICLPFLVTSVTGNGRLLCMSEQTTVPTERDELAEDIRSLGITVVSGPPVDLSAPLAQHLRNLGYRKPRTVNTLDALDALPFGSVILDRSGLSLHKNEFIGWRASNGAKDISPEMLKQEAFPATVLHEPEAAS